MFSQLLFVLTDVNLYGNYRVIYAGPEVHLCTAVYMIKSVCS